MSRLAFLPLLTLTACSSLLGLDDFQAGEGGASPATTTDAAASSGTPATTSTGGGSTSTATTSAGTGGEGGGGQGAGGEGNGGDPSTGEGGAGGGTGGGSGGEGGTHPVPTCDDEIQNGNEGGVDCGGDQCPPCEIPCPDVTHVCAPPVAGWTGPLALVDSAIGCGEPFPQMQLEVHDGLRAAAASCDCSCGTPNVTCPTRVDFTGASEATCQILEAGTSAMTNVCAEAGTYTQVRLQGSTTATCAAGSVAPEIPEPTWDTDLTACDGFGEAGTCVGDAVCVPSPIVPFEQGHICVVHVGDTGCPAGYPNRRLHHANFDDGRDCPSTCSCAASGSVCRNNVQRYTSRDCTTGVQGAVTIRTGNSSCQGSTINSFKPGSFIVDVQGTCTATDPAPTGSVDEVEPYTICCL